MNVTSRSQFHLGLVVRKSLFEKTRCSIKKNTISLVLIKTIFFSFYFVSAENCGGSEGDRSPQAGRRFT